MIMGCYSILLRNKKFSRDDCINHESWWV